MTVILIYYICTRIDNPRTKIVRTRLGPCVLLTVGRLRRDRRRSRRRRRAQCNYRVRGRDREVRARVYIIICIYISFCFFFHSLYFKDLISVE